MSERSQESMLRDNLRLSSREASYRLGWAAATEAAAEWLRNEDIENDPDDLYTGRAERMEAVLRLRKG